MIVGHNKIINFLNKSIERNKISHAYLFTGPKSVGKFTVALDFAGKIVGGRDQTINPDLIIISPEIEEKNGITKEKDIKIEKIRELEYELSLKSYFGKYRVAIIDGAEKMTISAQNSLLKILEEPPMNCVLILVCQKDDKILPTIKSRCVIKKFSLVKENDIEKIIKTEKNKEIILKWSFNRPGLAINFKENDKELKKAMEAEIFLKNAIEGNLSEKFDLAEKLGKNKPDLIEKLNLWVVILRNIIFKESNFLKISPEKSLDLIQEIEKNIRLLEETNSNPKAILENLFIKF